MANNPVDPPKVPPPPPPTSKMIESGIKFYKKIEEWFKKLIG